MLSTTTPAVACFLCSFQHHHHQQRSGRNPGVASGKTRLCQTSTRDADAPFSPYAFSGKIDLLGCRNLTHGSVFLVCGQELQPSYAIALVYRYWAILRYMMRGVLGHIGNKRFESMVCYTFITRRAATPARGQARVQFLLAQFLVDSKRISAGASQKNVFISDIRHRNCTCEHFCQIICRGKNLTLCCKSYVGKRILDRSWHYSIFNRIFFSGAYSFYVSRSASQTMASPARIAGLSALMS